MKKKDNPEIGFFIASLLNLLVIPIGVVLYIRGAVGMALLSHVSVTVLGPFLIRWFDKESWGNSFFYPFFAILFYCVFYVMSSVPFLFEMWAVPAHIVWSYWGVWWVWVLLLLLLKILFIRKWGDKLIKWLFPELIGEESDYWDYFISYLEIVMPWIVIFAWLIIWVTRRIFKYVFKHSESSPTILPLLLIIFIIFFPLALGIAGGFWIPATYFFIVLVLASILYTVKTKKKEVRQKTGMSNDLYPYQGGHLKGLILGVVLILLAALIGGNPLELLQEFLATPGLLILAGITIIPLYCGILYIVRKNPKRLWLILLLIIILFLPMPYFAKHYLTKY